MSDRRSAERIALPNHARSTPSFDEVFPRSSWATLEAMDAAGDDVANQPPRTPLALEAIGVNRDAIPVSILDPFDLRGTTRLACSVAAHVSLSARRRGIHVSRVGDLMAQLALETFPSLTDYAHVLC